MNELRALGPGLAARIFNTPLLIAPDKLQAILGSISEIRGGVNVEFPANGEVLQPAASVGRWESFDRVRGSGMLIDGGVGIIPITGTLVNRGAWIGTYSGLQSYDGIAQQLRMASDDDRVREVLLDLNSYGGEVGGVADLAAEIRELSEHKRVTALVADAAASAGYWLAAAAREVFVTETGIVGSIGVVLTHQDVTGAATKAGVKITHIHAGADKLLGSPFRPLSDSDREKLQAHVDQAYSMFVARVASYRGLDPKAVRATEARIYRGADGVSQGLADGVRAGRTLLAEIQARVAGKAGPTGARRGAPGTSASSDPQAGWDHAIAALAPDAPRANEGSGAWDGALAKFAGRPRQQEGATEANADAGWDRAIARLNRKEDSR